MPRRVTLRATLVLVALAFVAASTIQARLSGDLSAAKPAVRDPPGFVTNAPGLKVAKSLAAAGQVPALRGARKKMPSVRRVVATAPAVIPTPVVPAATISPTPTASPPVTPPAPPSYVPPAPSPEPATPEGTPAPTSTPPDSGEFDTTGEP
jgi:hypothetical protein